MQTQKDTQVGLMRLASGDTHGRHLMPNMYLETEMFKDKDGFKKHKVQYDEATISVNKHLKIVMHTLN